MNNIPADTEEVMEYYAKEHPELSELFMKMRSSEHWVDDDLRKWHGMIQFLEIINSRKLDTETLIEKANEIITVLYFYSADVAYYVQSFIYNRYPDLLQTFLNECSKAEFSESKKMHLVHLDRYRVMALSKFTGNNYSEKRLELVLKTIKKAKARFGAI